MQPITICQSCTMPIDNPLDRGTEKDGTENKEYCKYCYQNGVFTNPFMTYEQMRHFIACKMKELQLPIATIHASLNVLPSLKRWKSVSH